MKCPQCDSEFPLTWKRYFHAPLGGFDCPSCSTKLQGRPRWFCWPLMFLCCCILGVPLAILGSKYGAAGVLSGWYIGAFSIGIPFDRFLYRKFIVLKTRGQKSRMRISFHVVILLVLTIFSYGMLLSVEVMERKSVATREQKRLQHREVGRTSLMNYPGWCGFVDTGETELVIASFADECPLSRFFSSNCTMKASFALVVVMNRSLNDTVLVDSTKAVLMLADGRSVQCLPPAEVLGSYTKNADKMIRTYLGPHSLRPKSDLRIFIHVPFGFSWDDVTSVTLHLDSKPVIIQGRVFNAVEKAEFLEARKKARGGTLLSK